MAPRGGALDSGVAIALAHQEYEYRRRMAHLDWLRAQQQATVVQSLILTEYATQRAEYEQLRAELLGWAAGQIPAVKADALLRQRLGAARWRLFQETQVLMVPSRRWPGMDYRLRAGHPVEAIERGRLSASLCVVPRRGEPEADRLLTILDLIETDERKLWEMAKVSYSGQAEPPTDIPPQEPPPDRTNCECCGGRAESVALSHLWGGTSLCSPCWNSWSGGGTFFSFLKWLIGRPSVRCHPAAPLCGFNPVSLLVALVLATVIVLARLGLL